MANIRYISSRQKSFNLLSFDCPKLSEANFHNISWNPDTITKQFGTVIKRWTKDAQVFPCTFKVRGNYTTRKQIIDTFMYECEYDISHLQAGRIYWNEQYIDCYMNVSSTYPSEDGYTTIEAEFYAPYPFWIEELAIIIKPSEASVSEQPENVKNYNPAYPYDYAYPYAPTATAFTVNSPRESNFTAILYGPTNLCQFSINGYQYTVNKSLRSYQKLIIDSRESTPVEDRCYILNENGNKENVFDYRDVNNSIFKKIPTGSVVLDYTRTFGISLVVFQERSAPV